MQQPKALSPDTPLENLDRVSREHFRVAAVGIFIEQNPLDVLLAVVDGGEEKFLRIAKEFWGVHKFELSDYTWMFQRIQAVVKRKTRELMDSARLHG